LRSLLASAIEVSDETQTIFEASSLLKLEPAFAMTITYGRTITHLRDELVKEFGDSIESIVLYGSIARDEADEESDIDILVVTRENNKKIHDRISRIRTTIDLKNNTLTTLVQINRNELERYIKLGSPFMESVVEEGVILYDDGFFENVRKNLAFKG